jgi:hypothetical protein
MFQSKLRRPELIISSQGKKILQWPLELRSPFRRRIVCKLLKKYCILQITIPVSLYKSGGNFCNFAVAGNAVAAAAAAFAADWS